MLAISTLGNGKIEIIDIPKPKISDNEILLKVKASSICGTDIKIKNFGHFKNPEGKKIVLGHEVSGIIEQIGKNVPSSLFTEGMRVAIAPNIGCGHCDNCISGFTNYCENYQAIGITINGSFAEYLKIPYEYIIQGNISKISDSLSFEEASLVEPLSTVLAASESINIAPPDIVLIIGAGPMGILHLMMARLRGAKKIIVSEISDIRREQALQFGADIAVNPEKVNLKDVVLRETDSKGVNVLITAAPSKRAQEEALELIATKGRINLFGGLPKGQDIISIKSNIIHYKNILITGTTGQSIHQYRKAISIAESKKIDLTKLITARFSLKEAEKAFQTAVLESTLKVVFTI